MSLQTIRNVLDPSLVSSFVRPTRVSLLVHRFDLPSAEFLADFERIRWIYLLSCSPKKVYQNARPPITEVRFWPLQCGKFAVLSKMKGQTNQPPCCSGNLKTQYARGA